MSMSVVTVDNTWLSNNGPAPYLLSAEDTVYKLSVAVDVVPTGPSATVSLSGGAVTTIAVSGNSSRYLPTAPPTVVFGAAGSGVNIASGTPVLGANGKVASITVTHAGAGYGTTPPTLTWSGGSLWFNGPVFTFPRDKLTNIKLELNGHKVSVNGETFPQPTDGHTYRRTSQYTERAVQTDPHMFGGTTYNGVKGVPINDPAVQACSYESPALYNESTFAETK